MIPKYHAYCLGIKVHHMAHTVANGCTTYKSKTALEKRRHPSIKRCVCTGYGCAASPHGEEYVEGRIRKAWAHAGKNGSIGCVEN